MNIANLPNGQIFPLPDWSKVPWVGEMRKEAENLLKEIEKDENRTHIQTNNRPH